MRYLIVLAGLAVGALLCASLWLDEGEVVTLVTVDDENREFETGLWIVEVDGVLHLRGASPDAGWLVRLQVNPDVRLSRGEVQSSYRAIVVDDAGARDRVNVAMGRKYGRVDSTLSLVQDHAESVAIRLEPSTPAAVARGNGAGAAP